MAKSMIAQSVKDDVLLVSSGSFAAQSILKKFAPCWSLQANRVFDSIHLLKSDVLD